MNSYKSISPGKLAGGELLRLVCLKRLIPALQSISMDTAHIAQLLAPFFASNNADHLTCDQLTSDDLRDISTYIDVLLKWNARINLTAIRDPEQIVTRHFGESFFAARHLFPSRNFYPSESSGFSGAERLADLGSGAGFPGLPIKLWARKLPTTLIESNHKKATFLREVCRTLELHDIKIEHARAEVLPPNTFTVVTLRAVERCREVLPSVSRLLADGSRAALLTGSSQLSTVKPVLTSFLWNEPIPIPGSQSRMLLIGSKEQGR
jgi:16S rRNA (guanine527-N7)-methyltransferase